MLDLREESNRQIFTDFDGFGDKWRQSVADKYDDSTPPWQIFRDLLNMRAHHAKKHPVHYTFAVEGNHRRLALSCVCLAAVATHSQGKLCVGSMIDSELFQLDSDIPEDKASQLRTKLQSLLGGEEEMTLDDNLPNHCLVVSVRFVVNSTVSNEDVLKHLQERSKNIAISKKDSVEQAPFTNVGKLGYDFMSSIRKE